MKDCKWNPPTANVKGIHFSPTGEMLERAELNDVEDGTVMLKLVELTGKSKARRQAARQIQQWRQDGTLERIISGEIDPPGNWVRHIRNRFLDAAPTREMTASVAAELTGENLVPRALGALFFDAYDGGPYLDSPNYAVAYPENYAQRANLLRASLTMLVREGRLSREDLIALHSRTRSFVDANQNNAIVSHAFKLHPSSTLATELAVRHGSFIFHLDPQDPDDAKKAELLRHARVSFDDPAWSAVVSPHVLLDHAFTSQTPIDTIADLSSRLHNIALSAGSSIENFNRFRGDEPKLKATRAETLELLSVLHDPLDQRAFAIATAMIAKFADGDPAALASSTPNLPDGVSDLDRLTRAVAVGLKEGRIHGEPEIAAQLALDLLAGKEVAPDATIIAAADWQFGSLGTLTTSSLMNRAGKEATVAEILRAAPAPSNHWDTIVISKNPDPREVLAAVALRQARRNDGKYDATALGRLDAIAGEQQSLRSIASTAVNQSISEARAEDISATLALALVSDVKNHKPTEDLVAALDSFSTTGITPDVRDAQHLPATTVISTLMEEARSHAAGAPPAPRPSLPPEAEKLYATLRASVGYEVGCVADAYPGAHGPHFEQFLHVPFADDVNVPALIAHVTKALSSAPRRPTRASLAQGEPPIFPASVSIRSNKLVITHDSAIDAHRAVLESLAGHNGDSHSELLRQPRVVDPAWDTKVPAALADPEFERILAEDQALSTPQPDPARDRLLAQREAERQAAIAAGLGDPEFERLLAEDE